MYRVRERPFEAFDRARCFLLRLNFAPARNSSRFLASAAGRRR